MSAPPRTTRLDAALAGRYRIVRELGAGGMATVYLAEDLRHEREVAIKVLHPELAAALGGERFLSEIKTTARLQHPHILPLLDSGEADGQLYYVMPYVAGETLRARLDRERQLPVADAVRIAREVADALADAHAHGIVHRDIKPENILLQGGHALVADFGIALAVQQAGGQRMTQTGLSLGTPQYMSPEQAMGERTIDARADLYALAAVTYEMLTGEPPFTGATVQAIVAKVLTDEPRPIVELRKSVPEHVDAAVLRGLEKLPADRFESAVEFSHALGGETIVSTAPRRAARGARREAAAAAWRAAAITLGATTVAALVLAGWQLRAGRRDPSAGVVRFAIDAPSNVSLAVRAIVGASVAISPDGRTIAFCASDSSGTRRIYLRRLDEIEARPLLQTVGGTQPFFSPDGRWIAFWGSGRLQRIAVEGSAPQPIADMSEPTGATWSSSGVIVVSLRGRLFTVPADGGAVTPFAGLDTARAERVQNYPLALADGDHVLYSSGSGAGLGGVTAGVASLSGGKAMRLPLPTTFALGMIDDYLITANASSDLTATPVDLRRGRVEGESTPVLTGVLMGSLGGAKAALSMDGSVVYVSGAFVSRVVLVDGKRVDTLIAEAQSYGYPRFSPDGRHIALNVLGGAGVRSDIWIYDVATRTPSRLTNGAGVVNERPEWTPDGKRIVYRADGDSTRSSLWWQAADLTGGERPIFPRARGSYFEGVPTPDGRAIIYQVDTAGADVEYRLIQGDTVPHPIANTRYTEHMARPSPDGRWVAYVTDESGASQVMVQPFPGPGPRVQASLNGGTEPVWGRDGRHLYYRGPLNVTMVTYSTAGGFSVVARSDLFEDRYIRGASPHANYDVAPDGRLLMLAGSDQQRLLVVHGWAEELRARMASRARQR